ncbi:D-alanine--D-alanine ligase family protein [Candidatus Blochmanniella vafra str. BVAF]|uniref:D-alanine--D-alanine ligase n=1 Tax=Blochmanniella vafra (strain BVAF) TaxID=859654 RepID=E8Q737_BLOVB|nr:D-alanine--D-alanine ligase family protein [Candidatus Blochmannia vafer]ADV33861.1 D-alanine--D-alanine ligase family protein [Candidatus Blochmannia vafer str. BVAF]
MEINFNILRVGLICGGCSTEHEVSLQSAAYIMQHIDKNLFEIVVFWISKHGGWYIIYNDVSRNIFSDSREQKNKYIPVMIKQFSGRFVFFTDDITSALLKIDVIFPIIHGSFGEDGSLQGLIRIMNLPYVGSSILGSSICMDKTITKRLLRDSGLPVASFKTFSHYERSNITFVSFYNMFGLPFFIKPVNQGSSIGVSKVTNQNVFNKALDVAFAYGDKIMVEPCIVGRELECAVLGNDDPISSVCGEIVINSNNDNGFYTYYKKYISSTTEVIIPALITNIISDKVRHYSICAFQTLSCSGMARIDMFLTLNNQIIINEVNTLPGFTSHSMYPKLWEATGISPTLLLTKLITLSLERYEWEKYSFIILCIFEMIF